MVSDSDSTASGGTGDNTLILEEMLRQKIKYPGLLAIVDPEVGQLSVKAGIGNKMQTWWKNDYI